MPFLAKLFYSCQKGLYILTPTLNAHNIVESPIALAVN